MRPKLRHLLLSAVLGCLLLSVSGCASYAHRIRKPRAYLEQGQYDLAIRNLEELVKRKDNDELLYLLDLGTAYHIAGRYSEAIKTFLAADRIAEMRDYTSISQEATAVLLNDNVKPYKGESFEKILIHVYLAIDYTLTRQWEDALVECRAVNRLLDQLVARGVPVQERNAFAKYLAAALFEARGELNDALVDYRQLFKWVGDFPYLGPPLLRTAAKLRATEELERYRKSFPSVKDFKLGKDEGEVVVIVEHGRVPIKVPLETFRLLPRFQLRYYTSAYAWARDERAGTRLRTYPLFDIEQTAVKDLEHRIAGILAKKVGGVVVKETAAFAVQKATKSELLGSLTSLLLHASDQADLRSWTTLPARLELVRFPVRAGRQDIVLDVVTQSGLEVKGAHRFTNVEVRPGEIVFLAHRIKN